MNPLKSVHVPWKRGKYPWERGPNSRFLRYYAWLCDTHGTLFCWNGPAHFSQLPFLFLSFWLRGMQAGWMNLTPFGLNLLSTCGLVGLTMWCWAARIAGIQLVSREWDIGSGKR